MVYVTIRCEDCGEQRLGRPGPAGVEPVQEACPACGSEAFTVLMEE